MFDTVTPMPPGVPRGWAVTGTLRVKGRATPVEALLTRDELSGRFTGRIGAHRDALGPVRAQLPGCAFRPLGRRVDLALTLAVAPRDLALPTR